MKNSTPHAIKVTVPLGTMEAVPMIEDDQYEVLVAQNRRRYCASADEAEAVMEASTKPRDEGFELGEHEVL